MQDSNGVGEPRAGRAAGVAGQESGTSRAVKVKKLVRSGIAKATQARAEVHLLV